MSGSERKPGRLGPYVVGYRERTARGPSVPDPHRTAFAP